MRPDAKSTGFWMAVMYYGLHVYAFIVFTYSYTMLNDNLLHAAAFFSFFSGVLFVYHCLRSSDPGYLPLNCKPLPDEALEDIPQAIHSGRQQINSNNKTAAHNYSLLPTAPTTTTVETTTTTTTTTENNSNNNDGDVDEWREGEESEREDTEDENEEAEDSEEEREREEARKRKLRKQRKREGITKQQQQQQQQQKKKSGDNNENSNYHFCTVCDTVRPLRTKHCKKCERCVAKYDHHCFWIGTCVGEKNHHLFFTFLLLQTILLLWSLVINGSGLMRINFLDKEGNWGLSFALLMVCIVINIIFTLFPTILGCYHCYLISSNQTSYENNVRVRIPYLKHAPYDALLFDEGCSRNWSYIFASALRDNVVAHAVKPYIAGTWLQRRLAVQHQYHQVHEDFIHWRISYESANYKPLWICENEYYHCCC